MQKGQQMTEAQKEHLSSLRRGVKTGPQTESHRNAISTGLRASSKREGPGRGIFTPKGRIPIKRDQFGADLLAMRRETPAVLVFVQVKLGAPAKAKTVRTFRDYPFPWHSDYLQVWLVVWKARARDPRVLDVTDEVCEPL